jgi:hypothetical protein
MDFETELRGILAPPDPGPRFTEETLHLVRRARARRRSGWIILGGALLAVAAAAAMFAMRLVTRPPEAVVAVPLAPSAAPPAVSTTARSSVTNRSTEEGQAVSQSGKPFTVAVLPLKHENQDAPNRAAAEEVYAALLKSLPSIPNLVLVGSDTRADFTMAVIGKALWRVPAGADPLSANSPEGLFRVQVRVDSATQPINEWDKTVSVTGTLPDLCQVTTGRAASLCATPTRLVPQLIEDLRMRVFPPDLSILREHRATLYDLAQSHIDRRMALLKLNMLSRAQRSGFWDDWEPADLEAAMDLAKDAPDNWMSRANTLEIMQEVKNPDFVQPLVAILQQDVREEVRMEAARILGQNFAGDSTARSALEAAARMDSSPLMRQVTQRILIGEKGWRDHVLATLNDPSRSAVEKVMPLVYIEWATPSRPLSNPAALVLDESMVLGVVGVFPSLMADPEWLTVSDSIMRLLENSNHPAVRDAMMQAIKDKRDPSSPATAATYLIKQYGTTPEVRRSLEESAETNDLVREILEDASLPPLR